MKPGDIVYHLLTKERLQITYINDGVIASCDRIDQPKVWNNIQGCEVYQKAVCALENLSMEPIDETKPGTQLSLI